MLTTLPPEGKKDILSLRAPELEAELTALGLPKFPINKI